MKLRNGHLTTWQMIRLLERHPDWTASAPEITNGDAPDSWGAMRASPDGHAIDILNGGGHKVPRVPCRNDWTVHRPSRKRRHCRQHIVSMDLGTIEVRDYTIGRNDVVKELHCLPRGKWEVVARRKG